MTTDDNKHLQSQIDNISGNAGCVFVVLFIWIAILMFFISKRFDEYSDRISVQEQRISDLERTLRGIKNERSR